MTLYCKVQTQYDLQSMATQLCTPHTSPQKIQHLPKLFVKNPKCQQHLMKFSQKSIAISKSTAISKSQCGAPHSSPTRLTPQIQITESIGQEDTLQLPKLHAQPVKTTNQKVQEAIQFDLLQSRNPKSIETLGLLYNIQLQTPKKIVKLTPKYIPLRDFDICKDAHKQQMLIFHK
ncbi:Hypothetical_protein [Hexamita inflata]|uniref:Hypothetical_protein n=1 Tax=Hexamita inflata TaxID=28002 RepID=A0AA86QJR0_9EUKA|nr:Hypothetical protein HINF_LOCUS22471 [Hexamita inflata]CAI9957652.1 Hypothetical protein HINF_LOCUS45297 [Hexamita inflata]CAI9963705.1 Hypothetical protein HINF_LOCUS51350 [Hexamita inflata]CAI9964563.1 Hypothetical protein HINF_LOCUS52208 [Hexamita inflata]